VWTTEVVADQVKFLDSKGKRETQEDNGGDPFQYSGKPIEFNDDDLPF
jgi:single-stranded DNA-binding protein